jgi:phosphoribosylglycinamide formyltransferase-1
MLSRSSSFRVALLCSRHAPGLPALLEDPGRGARYELVACVCSENELPPEAQPVEQTGVPVLTHPIRDFHRGMHAPLADRSVRALYDRTMVELLADLRPDLVLLDGYRYVVTAPMLEAFPDRILNVHHSDLTQRDDRGRPRYPGLRAVHAAVLCGERETRATAHFVTPELDDGPLLLRSPAFPVAPMMRDPAAWRLDVFQAYASAHARWMLRAAFGPLLVRSVELLSRGRVQVVGGTAWIDGAPGPLDLTRDGELAPPGPPGALARPALAN